MNDSRDSTDKIYSPCPALALDFNDKTVSFR